MPESAKQQTLEHLLSTRAEQDPQAIAVLYPGRTALTYQGLYAQIQNTIASLNAKGLGRGDRIAIVLPNSPEMAVAFLAITACAASAPLNPAYGAADFDFYLGDLNTKALIVLAGLDSPARAVAAARGIPVIELVPHPQAQAGVFHLEGDTGLPGVDRDAVDGADIALVLHTSGTTSRPKLVPLTQANLSASARNVATALELSRSDRCLNVMPLFHIHGLVAGVLASLSAGGSVVCAPGFVADSFFEWLETLQPTWYTAVPTIHQAILAQADAHRRRIQHCSLRLIRSSSSALPPQVMNALKTAFHVPVIEAYGMTEASHQIASNPLTPGTQKARSVGLAAGPELAIMDETGKILGSEESGEIVIRGANVTLGYENNPQANAGTFTHGWFRTGDQGYLDDEGYLFITGRLKELINRGGENISPREVDEVLLDCPAIVQAVTFAIPHPTLGENIAAAVVLHPNALAGEREIRQFAAARLPDFKVPGQIIILKDIPKGPTGKLQRIGLADKLASQLKITTVAPRTATERMLAAIWSEVLNKPTIGIHDNFFALGGDSLHATQVMSRLFDVCQVELPLAVLFQAPTIEQMAEAVKSPRQWSHPWHSLIPIQTSGSRPALFGIHNLYYKALATHIGWEQPVYGLRYGLAAMTQNRPQSLPGRIEDLATHYIQEMRIVQPEGPYFLMAPSFGGTVALEMAQQLLARDQKVALLILFDSPAPDSNDRTQLPLNEQIANLFKAGPGNVFEAIWDEVRQRFERFAKRNRTRQPEQHYQYNPAVHCPIGERHFFAPYHPKPYPGKVLFFKASDDDGIDELDRRSSIRHVNESLEMKWRKICPYGLDYIRIPGGHSSILEAPHVALLAEKITIAMDQALENEPQYRTHNLTGIR